MPFLDISNIWAVGVVAERCGATAAEVDEAAEELGIIGSAINGVPYVDTASADRIARYITMKRKAERSPAPPEPRPRCNN